MKNEPRLVTIEKQIRTSRGFTTGGTRRPLDQYVMKNGMKCWLFVIDADMATMLRLSSGYQTLMQSSDTRGNENRNIRGYMGKVGALIIVEADQFFGTLEEVTGSGDWFLRRLVF